MAELVAAVGAVASVVSLLEPRFSTDREPWISVPSQHPDTGLDSGFYRFYDYSSSPRTRVSLVQEGSLRHLSEALDRGLPAKDPSKLRVHFVGIPHLSNDVIGRLEHLLDHFSIDSGIVRNLLKQIALPALAEQLIRDEQTRLAEENRPYSEWTFCETYGMIDGSQKRERSFTEYDGFKGSLNIRRKLLRFRTSFCFARHAKDSYIVLVSNLCSYHEAMRYETRFRKPDFANFELPTDTKLVNEDRTDDPVVAENLMKARNINSQYLLDLAQSALITDVGSLLSVTQEESLGALMAIRCYRARLRSFLSFLNKFEFIYCKQRDAMMDPSYFSLQTPVLKEIVADAYYYRAFRYQSLETLRNVERLDLLIDAQTPDPIDPLLKRYVSAAITLARSVMHRSDSLEERLSHHLRYLDHTRNVHESHILKVLSQLASIFLPLSVATGILSIQNRLNGLGGMFYDFCGVVAILGTLAVVCIGLLALYTYAKIASRQLVTRFRVFKVFASNLITVKVVSCGILLAFWALVLASFLVGSFKDIGLGLKILGFGSAATLGIFAIVPVVALLGAIFWLFFLD